MAACRKSERAKRGFTLIELSIVLVIIGLIVGGIVVGNDLIAAAAVRATVSQVDKFTTATNAFRDRYGFLPGDIPPPQASALGFFTFTGANAGTAGFGDASGYIDRQVGAGTYINQEALVFWRHLSDAKLIDGSYGTSSSNLIVSTTGDVTTTVTATGMAQFLPPAKLGLGNYFYVASKNITTSWPSITVGMSNYFSILAFTALNTDGTIAFNRTILPTDAYTIDSKIDDGMPNTGRVIGQGLNWSSGSTVGNCLMGGANATDSATTYNINGTAGKTPACQTVFIW